MDNFTKVSESQLRSVGVTLHQYVHSVTQARHLHLESSDENNAFMVAFPTLPTDSTGVAHILEHTVLCGSERYPVRDPFFMMLRRSLNTYMNAFTASDTTAYPFATRNKKDFYNLLAVYLDAVFFPNLNPLDFAQEGWRLEYQEDAEQGGSLTYHGVVYNEMKGAMSSPIAQLWNHLHLALFPDTIYAHNSGGEPSEIPNLQYSQLCEFHSHHYNPTNAVFMTYGDLPWIEHQAYIERLVLNRFEKNSEIISIPAQQPFRERQELEVEYQTTQNSERSTHAIWGWVYGSTSDADSLLEMHFLASLLLEHSGSPLRNILETLESADAPSELCGIDDSTRQVAFICGVEGADEKFLETVEARIYECLESLVEGGLSDENLTASLDRLELEQRDIGGGTYPHGLSLMGRILSSVIYRKDPVQILDLGPSLSRLRGRITQDNYLNDLISRVFINNPHHAKVVMRATSSMDRKMDAQIYSLQKMYEKIDRVEIEKINNASKSLEERQSQKDDESVLPKVTLTDIPETGGLLRPRKSDSSESYEYEVETNGIFRIRMAYALPFFTKEEIELLPFFCAYVTELGTDEQGYVATQERRGRAGEFSVSCLVKPHLTDLDKEDGFILLNGKGLARKRDEVIGEVARLIRSVRFDEIDRLRDLLYQTRAEVEQSLVGRGHYLAMFSASKGLSNKAALDEVWDGGTFVLKAKKLASSTTDGNSLKNIFESFEIIRSKLMGQLPKIMVIGEEESLKGAIDRCKSYQETGRSETTGLNLAILSEKGPQAWLIDSQVNFSALAFSAVGESSQDAPVLAVLGKYLQDGFLHSEIREKGGAYGSGAGYNAESRTFRFFSYRDPRLLETVVDFRRSLDWFLKNHSEQRLEESILGTIRSLDPSRSPIAEADRSFVSALFSRNDASINSFRTGVLGVTHDAMSDVCDRYLMRGGEVGFVAGKVSAGLIEAEGFDIAEI